MDTLGILLAVLGVYLAAGVVFAAGFVTRGVGRVDAVAEHAGAGFRAVIFPGCVALWPVLVVKWARAAKVGRGT